MNIITAFLMVVPRQLLPSSLAQLIREVSMMDTEINNTGDDIAAYATINIAGVNCRGLLNKVDSLLLSASLPHNAWHVICLQETHEAAYFNEQNLLVRHGWKYYSSRYIDNDNNDNLLHPRRGTAIYVRDALSKQWHIVQHDTSTDLVTWITMSNKHKRLHVLSVYSLDVSKSTPDKKLAYHTLTGILNDMNEDDGICIQGDFNASISPPNNNTNLLNDFIEHQQLHIMPNDLPTYIGPLSATIIDHFLMSPSLLQYITQHYVEVSPPTITHPPSDHRALSIRLYATNIPPPSLDTILPST